MSIAHESQRERYLDLGVPADVIHVTGHTKYDTEPKVLSDSVRASLREHFFPGESSTTPIVVLGSLRPNEEVEWLSAVCASLQEGRAFKVILAPRHMEKVDYFSKRLNEFGLSWRLWSDAERTTGDVVLLDTMGRLEDAYSIAQLAFVGGTLVDIGGHNPLEPAMYAVPVVVGPYVSVIRDVVEELRSNDAILELSDARGARALLDRVATRDSALCELGIRGQNVWLKHRGASKRVLSVVTHA